MMFQLLFAWLVVVFSTPRELDIRWYGYEAPSPITATGVPFDPQGLTYASRSDIIGTVVRVDWKGKSVTVRCNDRGPNEVELTLGAFSKLEDPRKGILKKAKVTKIQNIK
jgi:rare lipoprotein A (peptidoglycan hydrolase)